MLEISLSGAPRIYLYMSKSKKLLDYCFINLNSAFFLSQVLSISHTNRAVLGREVVEWGYGYFWEPFAILHVG